MIVDDSAVVRQVLSAVLNEAVDINVYRVAGDPLIAQRYMELQWPDVIVLDIEMPRMDGLTFLKQIMKTRPTPVVICSSLATKGCELSLTALASGALDIVTKPQGGLKGFLLETKQEFWRIIRAAAAAKPGRAYIPEQTRTAPTEKQKTLQESPPTTISVADLARLSHTTDRIIAVGTSTGGTMALEYILPKLARTCPGIAVVQHMPEKFTAAFAQRLDGISQVEVREAQSGDRLLNGRVLIAPGGHHLEVQRSGAQYVAKVFRGPPVNRHCPSVDVLFRSVAKSAGKNALGVIMTGMGDDGALGLLEMRKQGAFTLAQDEESSVVYGMAKEAVKLGAAQEIASLFSIPEYFH